MDERDQLLAYRLELLCLLEVLAAVSHEMTDDDTEGVDLALMPAVHKAWNRAVDASDLLIESLGGSRPLTSAFLCQNAMDLNRIAAYASLKAEKHDPVECLARAVGNRTELRLLQAWRDRLIATDLGPMFAELKAPELSRARPPKEWENVFDCSWDTIKRRIADGSLTSVEVTSKRWRFAIADLPSGYDDTVRRYTKSA